MIERSALRADIQQAQWVAAHLLRWCPRSDNKGRPAAARAARHTRSLISSR